MGKKDTQGVRAGPIDGYRKQIGKHDYKKSKAEVKNMKNKADMKQSAMGIKDVTMVLFGFLVLLIGIYLILWVSIGSQEKTL